MNAIAGLGYVFTSRAMLAMAIRPLVALSIRLALAGERTRVILQNDHDRQVLCTSRMVERSRTRLIGGSGVDIDRFQPDGSRPSSRLRILLASRLLWDKGIGEYMAAARTLTVAFPDFEFLLAGDTDPGNPASIASEVVQRWSQEGVVNVLGHVEDMASLLRSVDVVVLPTAYGEGVPRILLEAAASGLPIVATDAPGCRALVEDGLNGWLVPARNAEALVAALTKLRDAEMRLAMGCAGRRKVRAEFDEKIVFSRTWAVYSELLPGLRDPDSGAVRP